jgi:CRP/FNR family transcriptional regulator, transcriptional activator FtrB
MRVVDGSDFRLVDLFAQVADDHYDALLARARLQCCPRHTTLFNEGDRPEFLHILVEGAVELFAQIDPMETTISVLRPTSVFVLAAVVGDVPYLASGRTLKESRVLAVPAEAVRGAFDRDRNFARAVARELSRGFCDMLAELKNQKLLTCVERIADWLLRADVQFGGSGRFTLPFDKRTLASQLGMTPENLSRNLKCLSGHGAVVRGRNVILEDPAALAAMARPQAFQGRVTPPLRRPNGNADRSQVSAR